MKMKIFKHFTEACRLSKTSSGDNSECENRKKTFLSGVKIILF